MLSREISLWWKNEINFNLSHPFFPSLLLGIFRFNIVYGGLAGEWDGIVGCFMDSECSDLPTKLRGKFPDDFALLSYSRNPEYQSGGHI